MRFSTLSSLVSSSNFGLAHSSVALVIPSRWSNQQYHEPGRGTVAGTSDWPGCRLPPSWAGYKYGAGIVLDMCAFLCQCL